MAPKSLGDARKALKLTQQQLADISGLSQYAVTQIETGESCPNKMTRKKLESILGPIDWLESAEVMASLAEWLQTDRNKKIRFLKSKIHEL